METHSGKKEKENMVLNYWKALAKTAFDDNTKLLEENRLLRISEQAAIRSQKESFEESDKIIQSQKAEIEELKKDNERLRGKVKEAFEAGSNYQYFITTDIYTIEYPDWEQWSKDNSINQQ